MMHKLVTFALGFAALACFVDRAEARSAPSPVQSKGWHSNARFGFKFKPPKKWAEIPLQADEDWLVAKYLSDRSYYHTNEDTKWTTDHKPELMVIAFIEKVVTERKKKKTEEDPETGESTTTIEIRNPYKNYEDFLDRTYSGGGWHIAEKKEATIGKEKLKVTKYVIKVEKLSYDGPKRIVTWIFHAPEVDFAVQVEVLESSWNKCKRMVESTLKSFALIERTEGPLPTEAKTRTFITIRDMTEGTPADRRKAREESARQLHERAKKALPEGWTSKMMGQFLVLSHTDAKYTKRVAGHANAIFDWLDKTFGYVGPEEYVRQPILRICKNDEEKYSFQRGVGSGGGWFSTGVEVVTVKDDGGFIGYQLDFVNTQLVSIWFQDRDRDLYYAMPEWLDYGIDQFIENARAKGRKLEFREDDWARDDLRALVREGKATSPKELMKMTSTDFHNGRAVWNRMDEAGALVHFLLTDGQKNSKTKSVISDYVRNLRTVTEEMRKKDMGQSPEKYKAPETEEEEEAQYKERRETWKKREREVLDDVYFRTFRNWKDSDWRAFEKAYFNFIS